MSDWLVDYYALTTVVLVTAVVVMGRLRQPARRLSVAWSSACGLLVLAVLTALPVWPRTSWPVLGDRLPPNRPTAGTGLPQSAASPTLFPTELVPALPESSASPAAIKTELFDHPDRARVEKATSQAVRAHRAESMRSNSDADWPALGRWVFCSGAGLMLVWLLAGSWHTAAIRRRSVFGAWLDKGLPGTSRRPRHGRSLSCCSPSGWPSPSRSASGGRASSCPVSLPTTSRDTGWRPHWHMNGLTSRTATSG